MAFLWDAFWTLHGGRQMGAASPQPIAVSDVMAFCAMAGMANPADRMHLLHAVQAMDVAYLDWAAETAKRGKGAGR